MWKRRGVSQFRSLFFQEDLAFSSAINMMKPSSAVNLASSGGSLMSMRRSLLLFVALVLALGISSFPMAAQSTSSGSVAGTVTDNTGAVVAGAKVTLVDKSTGDTRTTVTNAEGHYIFPNIVPSAYDIKFSKSGFSETVISNRTVLIGTALTENVQMKLGAISQTITVTESAGAELQTMNATVGNTVTGIALESLPAIGRDATTFLELQPGISPDGSVAGAVVDQSTFMLDGGNNTNDMDGSMGVYTPSYASDPTGGLNTFNGQPTGVMPTPLDSVEEFKVNTTNQTADFNSSAGAQVEMVTKRGTNNWHGTAYEYYLDNTMSSNSWQNTLDGTPLPDYHYSRFGVAGGGPVLPKEILGGKTYIFANYQGFRFPNATSYARSDPTPGMELGLLQDGTNVFNLNPYSVLYPSSAPAIGALVPGTTYAGSSIDPRALGISPTVQQMWTKYMPGVQQTGVHSDPGCNQVGVGEECDGLNEQGYVGTISLPQTDNFGVVRLDHDFGAKWHFNSSFRYYHLNRSTENQVDIGGFFAGDTLGTPSAVASRPQVPWYYVAGLTTNINPNTTNDFHYSFLRNWWQWGDNNAPPQIAGLGGALEPFGESAGDVLAPFNVDTQDIRTRFWDGKDHMFRDDITNLHGNHLFQFGATYQHNWNYHERSDNGGGINFTPVYQLGNASGTGNADVSSTIPNNWLGSTTQWERDFAVVTGIVTDSRVAYTRQGADLTLNPPLTHAFDKSTIPYYNFYFSDSWHMKPTFTLTYGLGWTLEMPPVEATGKQVELVNDEDQQIDTEAYLYQREQAALKGQVYNPEVGFALVGNTGNHQKYPYNPFYGSFSPRIAVAWNPRFESGLMNKMFGESSTVVRGGYARIYGRLNGVDLVLAPLLGTGLIQPVECTIVLSTGCGGGADNASTAFRVGPTGSSGVYGGGWDGLVAPIPQPSLTLPQPVFPGINNASAAAGEALDPNFRPNVVDSFDLTVQRQFGPKMILEAGYIGRRITHEYQPINLNAVPYMMTLDGQSFASAYAAVETSIGCATSETACGAAIPSSTVPTSCSSGSCTSTAPNPAYTQYFNTLTPQPFFETSLANTGFCNQSYAGVQYTSCTAAAAGTQAGNFTSQSVWSLWSALDNGGINGGPGGSTNPGFNFSRSMMNSPIYTGSSSGGCTLGCNGQLSSGVALNASVGYGNYNAAFASLKTTDWHGLTAQQNFTFSKALGTGAFVQASSEYTPDDPFDLGRMYGLQNFNRKFVYNLFIVYQPPVFKGQHGFEGHVLGGWNISPIFTAGSGAPLYCYTYSNAQAYGAGDGDNYFDNEQCILTKKWSYGHSAHYNVSEADGVGASSNVNLFANPDAVWATVRAPILGLDNKDGGVGIASGQPYWNVDLSVRKTTLITERFSVETQFLFLNVLNHTQLGDPGYLCDCYSPTWGSITGQANNPRQMEFGLRLNF
jgi:hypothetical protein